jgi:hypothetical protein
MTMNRIFARCALASVALLGATFAGGLYAQAADTSQLAAAAGVTPAEAASLSLTELAAAKFNRDTRDDDQQTVSDATPAMADPYRHAQLIGAAGFSSGEAAGLTLSQLAAGAFNAGSDDDDAQPVVTMSSRGPVGGIEPHLAFAAGIDPAEAQGMTLGAVAAAKFSRDTGD